MNIGMTDIRAPTLKLTICNALIALKPSSLYKKYFLTYIICATIKHMMNVTNVVNTY